LPGKPDIVFPGSKVVVFCDGDFWHGKNWRALSNKLRTGSNPSYWIKKIDTNRRRDRLTNGLLSASGWKVLRVWESDIKSKPEVIAEEIAEIVRKRREVNSALH
jgi:DNA mismatch endonuclease (patch repair protein)